MLKKLEFILLDNYGDRQTLGSIAIISGILFLTCLGNLPLKDWDEGTYALVAREIVRTGDWLYLKQPGEPFLFKPPLGMWLIAISYSISGISEFTTRFPCAVLTAIGVPILYLVARQLFDRHLPALLTTLVYLTLLPIARHGRFAMLDGMSITFLLIALLCLLKSRQQRIWSIGIGIMLGLVILTKGILGLVFGFIIGLLIIAQRQFYLLTIPYFWLGIIIGQIPAIVWYGLQFQQYGNTFFQVHFQAQTFDRFATAIEGHPGPIWYYLIDIFEYTFPWWLFLGNGVISAWNCRSQIWAKFGLIGGGIFFAIVSIMQTKLPYYGLPVYPFFAIIIGADLAAIWEGRKPIHTKFRAIILIFVSGVSLLGCGYFGAIEKSLPLVIMGLLLSATTGYAAKLINSRNRLFIPTLCGGIYLVFLSLMTSHSWAWEINDAFPVAPVAQLIKQHIKPNTILYTTAFNNRPSLDFYSDTRVFLIQLQEVSEKLTQAKFILIDRDSRSKLSTTNYQILGSTERFDLIHRQHSALSTQHSANSLDS